MKTLTKICSKCGVEKPATLEYFHKDKYGPFKLKAECKDCIKIRCQNNYIKNRDKKIDQAKKYWEENKERLTQIKKDHVKNNREKVSIHRKELREKYKEQISEQMKQYYINNKEEINKRRKLRRERDREKISERQKQYRIENSEKVRANARDKYNDKIKNDLNFKIAKAFRGRIQLAIKKNYSNKSLSTIQLLGCDIETARKHIESQFTENMSWDNYGQFGWHIDHIVPISLFDLQNIEHQKVCFHYLNLQPLWWYDNLKKGNRIC